MRSPKGGSQECGRALCGVLHPAGWVLGKPNPTSTVKAAGDPRRSKPSPVAAAAAAATSSKPLVPNLSAASDPHSRRLTSTTSSLSMTN
jgi:hypothetical protein